MKKLLIVIGIGITGLAFTASNVKAQVSINVNIGSQPRWGPSGYQHVDYYYLPEIESYYYVPTHQFIYLSNGRWTFAAGLPDRYRGYDLYNGYKVVINEPRPYMHFDEHRERYSHYRSANVYRQYRDEDDEEDRYDERQRGGNPHGMPPGQAKKYYQSRYDDHGDRKEREHGHKDD